MTEKTSMRVCCKCGVEITVGIKRRICDLCKRLNKIQSGREYRIKNKHKCREYYSKYHQENKDRIKKYREGRREKQKEYMDNYIRIRKVERPWFSHYHAAKQRCESTYGHKHYKDYGIKFLMTQDEIKDLWFRDKAMDMERPSIDRIDPRGHYIKQNCRFLEFKENMRRRFDKCVDIRVVVVSQ